MLKIILVIICALALFYLGIYLAFNVQAEWLRLAIALNTVLFLAAGIVWVILIVASHYQE